MPAPHGPPSKAFIANSLLDPGNSRLSGRVFVVDDQKSSRLIIGRILKSLSRALTISEFEHPVEALAAATHTPPDMILLDYHMPEMTGIELTRAMRACRQLAATPIIMLTISSDEHIKREALNAGVNDFISRPFQIEEVAIRCRNTLLVIHQYQVLRQHQMALIEAFNSTVAGNRNALQEILDKLDALDRNVTPEQIKAIVTPQEKPGGGGILGSGFAWPSGPPREPA